MPNYFIASLAITLSFVAPFSSAATLCNHAPAAINNATISERHLPLEAVVRIASPLRSVQTTPNFPYYGHGSGVLINIKGEFGFVLSASHVTAGHPLILVSINKTSTDNRILWAKFVKEDKDLDLSLYKIIDDDAIKTSAELYVGDNEIYQQTLFTVGYPIQITSLSKAELFPKSKIIIRQQNLLGVSEYLGVGLKIKPLIMSDCIETGLSGGPVFDNEGHVFGINHSTDKYRNSQDSPVNGYIVSSAHIMKFLE
ncbi:MAG: hypothetical protein GQ475_02480 [Methylococcaceae bacterium]|nr:hypothetical protein [Methylococcaceae bacterium]